MYQELGLESLKEKRWLRRVVISISIFKKLPSYLYELIPPIINSHRGPDCCRALYCRTDLFGNSFLAFSINDWNKSDPDIGTLDSHAILRKMLLIFCKPFQKNHLQYL